MLHRGNKDRGRARGKKKNEWPHARRTAVFCAYRKQEEKHTAFRMKTAQTMPYKNKAREDMLHIVYSGEALPVFNYYFYQV